MRNTQPTTYLPNSQPLISVVIPAYNHEKFVGAAIESVLQQSFQNFELIVIDDGSVDKTGAIVQSYNDDRIIYRYQKNQDAPHTINRGMGMARGRYISILNSDDIYTSNRLERLLAIQKKTDAVCLFTNVIPIGDDNEILDNPDFGWNLWHRKNRSFYFQAGDLYTAFLKGNFMVTTSNLFMRQEVFKKVGDFSFLRYLHDYDYIFRIMLTFPERVVYVENEKLLYYRIHSGNTLNEAAIIGREQDMAVIRKYMLLKLPDEQLKPISSLTDRLVELEKMLIRTYALISDSLHQKIKKYLSVLMLKGRRLIIRSYLWEQSLKKLLPITKAGTERLVELEHELAEVRAALDGTPPVSQNIHSKLAGRLIDKLKTKLL